MVKSKQKKKAIVIFIIFFIISIVIAVTIFLKKDSNSTKSELAQNNREYLNYSLGENWRITETKMRIDNNVQTEEVEYWGIEYKDNNGETKQFNLYNDNNFARSVERYAIELAEDNFKNSFSKYIDENSQDVLKDSKNTKIKFRISNANRIKEYYDSMVHKDNGINLRDVNLSQLLAFNVKYYITIDIVSPKGEDINKNKAKVDEFIKDVLATYPEINMAVEITDLNGKSPEYASTGYINGKKAIDSKERLNVSDYIKELEK